MAFTDAQKVQIRRYLGSSPLDTGETPSLDSSITTVEGLGDGGETETFVGTLLTNLGTVETRLAELWSSPDAYRVDETTVDAARGRAVLCAEGRRLVGQLSDVFNFAPRRDVFSPQAIFRG